MPRGKATDREAVASFIKEYHAEHGERPTQALVAKQFGVTPATVGNIVRADSSTPGENRGQGRRLEVPLVESDQIVYDFIRRFTLEYGWAPSQREVAGALGCAPHKANFHLHRLHKQNLIELGPNPREVKIVGTKMEIPEVTL